MGNEKKETKKSSNRKKRKMDTKNLVIAALLTAMVVVLQLVGSGIRIGIFSISLVLVPIVVGAATCGAAIGAWLGFVFGIVVLLSGDANPFLAVNAFGTIVTVILKGVACGYVAALIYKLVFAIMQKRAEKKIEYFVDSGVLCANCKDGMYRYVSRNSQYIAVITAAVICPVVNTGIFLLGCMTFFMDTITAWGKAAGFSNAGGYMIFGLAGINFLIELAINIVLGPVIVRLINFRKKSN